MAEGPSDRSGTWSLQVQDGLPGEPGREDVVPRGLSHNHGHVVAALQRCRM